MKTQKSSRKAGFKPLTTMATPRDLPPVCSSCTANLCGQCEALGGVKKCGCQKPHHQEFPDPIETKLHLRTYGPVEISEPIKSVPGVIQAQGNLALPSPKEVQSLHRPYRKGKSERSPSGHFFRSMKKPTTTWIIECSFPLRRSNTFAFLFDWGSTLDKK